jgi:hypothetical protein
MRYLRKNRRLARAEKTVKLNHAVLRKEATLVDNMKDWEIIADSLSEAGWSWGCVSALDLEWRTIWIVDAHGYGKRFIVHADEKLSAFLELERAVCIHLLSEQCSPIMAATAAKLTAFLELDSAIRSGTTLGGLRSA